MTKDSVSRKRKPKCKHDMPSGPMSTMTSAATVVPAPPGVFATSMPPDLSHSASPVPSCEDRDSVSSSEGRRKHSGNGLATAASVNPLPSTYSSAPQFVIDSNKTTTSPIGAFSKHRKKIRSNRSRVNQNGSTSYAVNKPIKVTIRRTNAHSHTLDSNQTDGRISPSSVYSSVPGDDEKSPVLPSGLSDGFRAASSPHSVPNTKVFAFSFFQYL